MKALKRHTSPGLVISLLALTVAIGSTGAIALPGSGKVDANDLKRNTVASKHIKANTIKPGDVDEGKFYIGVEVNGSGAVTESTIPGVSGGGFTGNDVTITFPRDVTKCVPVAMGQFQATNVVGFQSGTAAGNRNKVSINSAGVDKGFNLVLVCK